MIRWQSEYCSVNSHKADEVISNIIEIIEGAVISSSFTHDHDYTATREPWAWFLSNTKRLQYYAILDMGANLLSTPTVEWWLECLHAWDSGWSSKGVILNQNDQSKGNAHTLH